jgi:hypothetical protein
MNHINPEKSRIAQEVCMKLLRSRTFWGCVFIAGGILFLLQSLNVLKGEELFWGLLFGLIGGLFLTSFFGRRSQWWFLVPGMLFLGIGASLLSEAFLPSKTADVLSGLLILGSLGVSFWLIYLLSPVNWWAIIPGGVMVTLAIVSVLDEAYPDKDTGGVFLIGLGLTFGLLGILPRLRMRWAYIPAVVLFIIGCIVLASSFPAINFVWPVLLILVGLYVLLREMGFLRR